jgi:hypothetical protein
LLNTKLSDGSPLVEGKRLTGLSWMEEILAGVAKKMPYNAEAEMKQRGARYTKAFLPFVSYAVPEGRLVTGQNPWSARATAQRSRRCCDGGVVSLAHRGLRATLSRLAGLPGVARLPVGNTTLCSIRDDTLRAVDVVRLRLDVPYHGNKVFPATRQP